MKKIIFLFLVVSSIGVFFSPSAMAISSTFDLNDEGWTVWPGEGAITHQSTGGNPGGFLKIEDIGPSSYVVYPSNKFKGDLSAYDGETLSYDVTVFDPTAPLASIGSGFGRIQLNGGGSNTTFDYAGNPPIPSTETWTTYSVPLTAAAWNTSQSNWETVLSDITYFDITLDLRAGSDTIGFDNFTVTPEPASSALFLLGAGALALKKRGKKPFKRRRSTTIQNLP